MSVLKIMSNATSVSTYIGLYAENEDDQTLLDSLLTTEIDKLGFERNATTGELHAYNNTIDFNNLGVIKIPESNSVFIIKSVQGLNQSNIYRNVYYNISIANNYRNYQGRKTYYNWKNSLPNAYDNYKAGTEDNPGFKVVFQKLDELPSINELENNLHSIYSEVMSKLIPENIKSGVTILNVTGTYTGN